MKKVVISLPGNEELASKIQLLVDGEKGEAIFKHFPDGESYVRLITDVLDKEAVVIATMHRPDDKFLPLVFLLRLLKDAGTRKVTLVAPYLAYMRQDKQFKPGEAVTSAYFANLISMYTDKLITIDPHLHRRKSMSEIYTSACSVLHASKKISEWIKVNVHLPVVIGPDSESEQWVSEVARNAGAPYLILSKQRRGDRDVKISIPELKDFKNHTPVLVDDIISTAHTMIETTSHLKSLGTKKPVCIGVHAVFSDQAYEELLKAGVAKVVTCNTIPHPSNEIDLSPLLGDELRNLEKWH